MSIVMRKLILRLIAIQIVISVAEAENEIREEL